MGGNIRSTQVITGTLSSGVHQRSIIIKKMLVVVSSQCGSDAWQNSLHQVEIGKLLESSSPLPNCQRQSRNRRPY